MNTINTHCGMVVKQTDEDGRTDQDKDDGCWVVCDLDAL
jgi:hypothetical protein